MVAIAQWVRVPGKIALIQPILYLSFIKLPELYPERYDVHLYRVAGAVQQAQPGVKCDQPARQAAQLFSSACMRAGFAKKIATCRGNLV